MHRRFSVVLLLILFLLGEKGTATHLSGIDLSVVHKGTDSLDKTYRITLSLFGYCDPNGYIPFNSSAVVYIKSASLNYTGTKILNMRPGPDDVIDQLCPNSGLPNTCQTPNAIYPGNVRRVYTDTMMLPDRATDYEFSYSVTSRTNSNTNVDVQTYNEMYVSAGLDNQFRIANSTPVYDTMPVVATCVNQTYHYLNHPTDVDADSLVTFATPARQQNGEDIGYLNGFLANSPFGIGVPYHVDSLTGTTTLISPNTGRYIVAFRTNKYDRRTGRLIAYTTRENQIPVFACANPAPLLTGPGDLSRNALLLANGRVRFIDGAPGQFDLTGTPGSTLSITSDIANRLPGATLTQRANGPDTVIGTFAWTPPASAIGDHEILFTIMDTACNVTKPMMVKDVIIVPITVIPSISRIARSVKERIRVYPNPACNKLYIASANLSQAIIEVRDIMGRTALTIDRSAERFIDIEKLAPGNYVLRVVNGERTFFASFVKQ